MVIIIFLFLISTFKLQNSPVEEKTDNQLFESETNLANTITSENILQSTTIDMNEVTFHTSGTDLAFEGLNVFIVERENKRDSSIKNASIYITDMQGKIINQMISPSQRWGMVSICNSTTFLIAPFDNYVYFWNIETNKTSKIFIGPYHHDVVYNHKTQSLMYLTNREKTIEGIEYYYDVIQEINLTGHLLWELDFMNSSIILPSYWNEIETINTKADITRANSLFWDFDEDTIFVNMRNINTFYKINHSNGDLIWGLGQYGNFSLYNEQGRPTPNLFYHAHAVEPINDNTFIIFDNGYLNDPVIIFGNNDSKPDVDPKIQFYSLTEGLSRIIEIAVNENSWIAYETWSWTGDRGYYSEFWGDADRLPNGNRLGVFGTSTHPDSEIGARLVEVNQEKDIVWELNIPHTDQFRHGIYRVERFRTEPIIEDIEYQWFAPTENVSVDWDTWYNYRTKSETQGAYDLFLNGTLIDSGIHCFQKYWRNSTFSVDLGILPKGDYNLTLVLQDEAGHKSMDTVYVEVSNFYLKHSGPLDIEHGKNNSILEWSGATISPLNYELSVNKSLLLSGVWNGDQIGVDLNSLAPGNSFIQMILFEQTQLVLNDSFWITIHNMEVPLIKASTSFLRVFWNTSISLSWQIFDYTPNIWSIYLNHTLIESKIWTTNNITIDWEAPVLDESAYNLTLVVQDSLGLISSSITWLIIDPPRPPVIVSIPEKRQIKWGTKNTKLKWEAHGATFWEIWRNNTLIYSELTSDTHIVLPISFSDPSFWFPALYNITLRISNDFGEKTIETIFVEIVIEFSDRYVNSILPSHSRYYSNADNIVGAQDGEYASIFSDYSNGFITSDMGIGEEIIDGENDDFIVYSRTGNYSVWANNDLQTTFQLVGVGSGNQSFNLGASNLLKVRYIRIEYREGTRVEIDAIEALHISSITIDKDPPQITGPDDYWIWENETSVQISWIASDITPFNYSVEINGILGDKGSWDGSEISYTHDIPGSGIYNFTLVLCDLFGNSAKDEVIVEVREINPEINVIGELVIGLVIVGLITPCLGVAIILTIKRRKM